jgi:uncharacterized protein
VVEGLRWRGETPHRPVPHGGAHPRRLVKGIKLYPGYDKYAINDPSLETVFRIAAKHDVPVMIHCGDTYAKDAKVRMRTRCWWTTSRSTTPTSSS